MLIYNTLTTAHKATLTNKKFGKTVKTQYFWNVRNAINLLKSFDIKMRMQTSAKQTAEKLLKKSDRNNSDVDRHKK